MCCPGRAVTQLEGMTPSLLLQPSSKAKLLMRG